MIPYSIKIEGNDKTSEFKKVLESLTIVDRAGYISDTATLVLVDDDSLELPVLGKKLEISLNNVKQGIYIIHRVQLNARKITVTAKSFDYKKSLQQIKSRSWDTTLSDIVSKIADEHSLKSSVSSSVKDQLVKDYQSESDLHFLTRITRKLGLVFKVDSGHLVVAFLDGKTSSGKELPELRLTPNKVKNISFNHSLTKTYTGIKTFLWDKQKGERVAIEIGDQENPYILDLNWNSQDEALTQAKAKLRGLKKQDKQLTITIIDPTVSSVVCGQPIILESFRQGVSGKWIASEVRKNLTYKGILLTIKCEENL